MHIIQPFGRKFAIFFRIINLAFLAIRPEERNLANTL